MAKSVEQAPRNKSSDYLAYAKKTRWWSSDINSESFSQQAETGFANYQTVPFKTFIELFELAVERNGSKPALRTENIASLQPGQEIPPSKPFKAWKTWTWREYFSDSKAFAKGCIKLGLKQHDSVNVYGFNSPAWAISTYGAVFAGGNIAGIYPTDTNEQIKFKSDQSNGAVAVVENEKGFQKFLSIANDLPYLKAIVVWGDQLPKEIGQDIVTPSGNVIKTFEFDAFLELGRSESDEEWLKRKELIKPGHCFCLVYTSGTTGNPKAVMITHDNLHYTATVVMRLCNIGDSNGEERSISYLPLSHVAGLMVDFILPVVVTSNINFKGHWCSGFARPYDLKSGKLIERLQPIKPTFVFGVPRIWEKIAEKLMAATSASKGLKKTLTEMASKKADIYGSSRQLGSKPKKPMNMTVANVVLHKIKVKLGMDKAKGLYTGAAPISLEVLGFLGSMGLQVYEMFGMSESTGVVTWSTPSCFLRGAIGFEIPGVEARIFHPGTWKEVKNSKDIFNPREEEQGEICFRGRNVHMGYMANPRLGEAHVKEVNQKNLEGFGEQGWFRTGDKGTRDVRGMFKLTGRYKELIIGVGGENIAPVPIEEALKRNCPLISNAVMIGNNRNYNVVLVTLKTVGASGELPGSDKLAGAASLISNSKTIAEACEDEAFYKTIRDAIEKTNKDENAVVSNAAKIQKFTILPRDFSVVTGEFTPTLKLKRNVVEELFAPIIQKMYESEEQYVRYLLAPTPGLPKVQEEQEVAQLAGKEDKFESVEMMEPVEGMAETDEQINDGNEGH